MKYLLLIIFIFFCSSKIFAIESKEKGIDLIFANEYEKAYNILIYYAEKNDPEAQTFIGLMHFDGLYVDSNIYSAHEWIKKAANQNFGWAQFLLADFYIFNRIDGGSVEEAYELLLSSVKNEYLLSYNYLGLLHEEINLGYHDIVKAIEYYNKADEINLDFAQYRLCVLYADGVLIDQDINKGIKYCKKSAEQNNSDAQYFLGQIYSIDNFKIKNYDEGFYWTKSAAEQNHPKANHYLGILYATGQGIPINLEKSQFHLQKAADFNVPESYYFVAGNYLDGDGVEKDIEKAIYYYEKAINVSEINNNFILNNIYASYFALRNIYIWEENFKNFDKAFNYTELLFEERGKPYDIANLAYMYENAIGTKQDYSKALNLYELAFEKGDIESSYDIGKFYYEGFGVDINYIKAEKFYKQYIDFYTSKSQEEINISYLQLVYSDLFYLYRYVINDKKNHQLAFDYANKAYEFGYDYAALAIGQMYTEGAGVKKDIEKAIYWLEIAIKKSNSEIAMNDLARIYEYEKQDYEIAFNLNLRAAEFNYSNASFDVARYYEKGIFVIKDLDTAAYWYEKSAEQGLITGAQKLAKFHSLNLLSDSSKEKEEYWLNFAIEMDDEYDSTSSTILARKLITGDGIEKDVDLGLQYLANAALNDPSMINEILLISKNKIINKKQSIELFNTIKKESSSNNLAKTSLAVIYNDGGLYQKKDTYKFLKLMNELINSPLEELSFHHGMAYTLLAQHYSLKGDNFEAESLLREGVIKFPNNDDYNLSRQLLISMFVAFLQGNGELDKALIMGKKLLNDSVGDVFDEMTQGLINCMIMETLFLQKDFINSISYSNSCLTFASQSEMNDNNMTYLKYKLMESINYANINKIYQSKKIYEDISNEIETFKSTSFFNYGIIQLLAFEGDLNYLWGNYQLTINIYNQIQEIILKDNTPITVQILSGSVFYLKALSALNNNDEALRLAQKMINDYLKINTINSNNFLLRDFHETYLDLLFKAHNITKDNSLLEESFIIAQVAKNDSLSKQISQTLFSLTSKDSKLKELINKKQGIEFQIGNIEKFNQEEILSGDNQDEFLNKTKIWNKLHKELDKTLKKINKKYPEYHSLVLPKKYSFNDISKILNRDELLMITFTGHINSYVWFVFNDFIYLQLIDTSKKELSASIINIRNTLDQSDIINANQLRPFDFENSLNLYNSIFQNIESKLKNINTIYAVLDDSFQSLPFETLIQEPIDQSKDVYDYQNAKWLVNKFNFTYLTGVNDLVNFKEINDEQINFDNRYIAFADPELSNKNNVIRSSISIAQLFDKRGDVNIDEIRNLPSLPETSDEVKNIANILQSNFDNLYLEKQATEKNVKSIDLSSTQIISFATHGLVNGEINGLTEPALVLTPPNELSSIDDGLLKSSEIALLDLNSELVVLSACNTASSDGTLGAEGLSGLAKSFFIAGSKSVLVSHWPVFSESTKDTMINLFESSKNNKRSYSKALQKAKLEMIKNNKYDIFAHPTFWAPFVIVGIN